MGYKGVVRGNTIELEDRPSLPDGTRVTVSLLPEDAPRKGSPQAVLRLAGALSPEEAEVILAGAQAMRRVDDTLWGPAD